MNTKLLEEILQEIDRQSSRLEAPPPPLWLEGLCGGQFSEEIALKALAEFVKNHSFIPNHVEAFLYTPTEVNPNQGSLAYLEHPGGNLKKWFILEKDSILKSPSIKGDASRKTCAKILRKFEKSNQIWESLNKLPESREFSFSFMQELFEGIFLGYFRIDELPKQKRSEANGTFDPFLKAIDSIRRSSNTKVKNLLTLKPKNMEGYVVKPDKLGNRGGKLESMLTYQAYLDAFTEEISNEKLKASEIYRPSDPPAQKRKITFIRFMHRWWIEKFNQSRPTLVADIASLTLDDCLISPQNVLDIVNPRQRNRSGKSKLPR